MHPGDGPLQTCTSLRPDGRARSVLDGTGRNWSRSTSGCRSVGRTRPRRHDPCDRGDSTGVRGQSLAPLVSTKTGTSMPPTGPPVDGAQEIALLRERLDTELGQRRNEIARLEERILEREESLERRLVELDGRERSLIEQEQSLRHRASEVEEAREQRIRELERVGTMSRATARRRSCESWKAKPATRRRARSATSRRRPASGRSGACAASCPPACSGSPPVTRRRRPCHSSSCRATT